MAVVHYRLTTVDNPYDPFTEFANWFIYDTQHGYNTCALLARLTKTAESSTEQEVNDEINRAQARIIELFPDLYKRVKEKKE